MQWLHRHGAGAGHWADQPAYRAAQLVAKTAAIVGRLRLLVAVELLVAAQACDLRGMALGPGVAGVHGAVRRVAAGLGRDRASAGDVAALDAAIGAGAFGG